MQYKKVTILQIEEVSNCFGVSDNFPRCPAAHVCVYTRIMRMCVCTCKARIGETACVEDCCKSSDCKGLANYFASSKRLCDNAGRVEDQIGKSF